MLSLSPDVEELDRRYANAWANADHVDPQQKPSDTQADEGAATSSADGNGWDREARTAAEVEAAAAARSKANGKAQARVQAKAEAAAAAAAEIAVKAKAEAAAAVAEAEAAAAAAAVAAADASTIILDYEDEEEFEMGLPSESRLYPRRRIRGPYHETDDEEEYTGSDADGSSDGKSSINRLTVNDLQDLSALSPPTTFAPQQTVPLPQQVHKRPTPRPRLEAPANDQYSPWTSTPRADIRQGAQSSQPLWQAVTYLSSIPYPRPTPTVSMGELPTGCRATSATPPSRKQCKVLPSSRPSHYRTLSRQVSSPW